MIYMEELLDEKQNQQALLCANLQCEMTTGNAHATGNVAATSVRLTGSLATPMITCFISSGFEQGNRENKTFFCSGIDLQSKGSGYCFLASLFYEMEGTVFKIRSMAFLLLLFFPELSDGVELWL